MRGWKELHGAWRNPGPMSYPCLILSVIAFLKRFNQLAAILPVPFQNVRVREIGVARCHGHDAKAFGGVLKPAKHIFRIVIIEEPAVNQALIAGLSNIDVCIYIGLTPSHFFGPGFWELFGAFGEDMDYEADFSA